MVFNNQLQAVTKVLNKKTSLHDEAGLPDHELGENSMEKKRRTNDRNYNILIAELKREKIIRTQIREFYLHQRCDS